MDKLKQVAKKLFNYVLPNRCVFCFDISGKDICDNCIEVNNACVRKIGECVPKTNHELSNIRNAYAAYWYNNNIKKLIKKLKYDGELYLARFCAKCMYEHIIAANRTDDYDVVIIVPKNGVDIIKRDNVPAIMARLLCKELNIKYCSNALKKTRKTKHQAKLDGNERRTNVIGAFSIKNKIAIINKRVLLLDDILTTGSTVNECAKEVMASGAIYCDVVCFATSEKF